MAERKYIVGIGELLWDMLPEGRRVGGAPANFAYHVSQFGLPGMIVSAVGDDKSGADIVEQIVLNDIDNLISTVPYPTGRVDVTVDTAGIPTYDIKTGAAWDNIPFTPELELLAQSTRAVCFGSLAQRSDVSRATIARFIDAVPREEDTLIVFDINLRQNHYTKQTLEESMRRCNILKINDEELEVVKRMFDIPGTGPAALCRGLIAMFGLRMVILTCGTEGSFVFTADEESFMTTPIVDVADTVGAGDSFTAAFIASTLKGMPIAEAHARAVATAAFVCSRHGATPTLPRHLVD